MMKNFVLPLAALVLGCSDSPKGNPAVLWLQPDNGEQNVKLGGAEPGPY